MRPIELTFNFVRVAEKKNGSRSQINGLRKHIFSK